MSENNPPLIESIRSGSNISPILAKLVVDIGTTILVGWVSGFEVLFRIHENWATSTPFTALGFVLSGAALIYLPQGKRGRKIAIGIALLLLLAMIYIISAHLFIGARESVDRCFGQPGGS